MNRGGSQRQEANGNRGNPNRPTPGTNQPSRGSENRHLPREFKYGIIYKIDNNF